MPRAAGSPSPPTTSKPNGLAFSPDEKILYVADTGASHDPEGPRHIRAFKVGKDGKLSGGEVFAVCDDGLFDGFRVDADGNVWSSAGDGVHSSSRYEEGRVGTWCFRPCRSGRSP